jgi:hypothetical protein
MVAKQMLYHLSHTSNPFLLWLFQRWSLLTYLPGLALNHNPPDLGPSRARITDMSHQHLTVF